jgi:hypothetical protein
MSYYFLNLINQVDGRNYIRGLLSDPQFLFNRNHDFITFIDLIHLF